MLERKINVTPAFDYILNDESKKRYGRGCADIWFILTGDRGTITFSGFTRWYLPETLRAVPDINNRIDKSVSSRMLAIHSKTELENRDSSLIEKRDYCEYTKQECYTYSYMMCSDEQRLIDLMVREGSDKLFDELEKIYLEVFNCEGDVNNGQKIM